jgi:ABC-type proline/glycine betaine transport system permease subunit
MDVSVLTQHLLISLLPWAVAVVVAGGLGTIWALAARSLFSKVPALRSVSMLLPWRTVAAGLPLLTPFAATRVGLGPVSAGIAVGLFVFLFALPLTVVVRLEGGYASPPLVRFIARIRTLAVASVALAAVVGPPVGGGGAGSLILKGMRTPDHAQTFGGFAVVVILAVTVDLVLGALQLLLSRGER